MRPFVPGLELARAFYEEAVTPLLGGMGHAAALIGWGSDVLGFDTERSTDHGWGPRLQLFVSRQDVEPVAAKVAAGLPDQFRGWPTRFGWDAAPVTHHVEVAELGGWLSERLGFDARDHIEMVDWLTTPQQLLLEITGGAVFQDGLGELESVRSRLAWYPDDIWLWLLACQWRRLDQEEPFVGRAAEVGDKLGSRVLTARLARDLMCLAFLFERQYRPYSKWLGTAFARLGTHAPLGEALQRALTAREFPAREEALVEAFRLVASRHNALGLTRPVPEEITLFHDRPFRVLGCSRFVEACLEHLTNDELRSLPLIGSIDQFVDSTDMLSYADRARLVQHVYDRAPT